MIYTISSPSMWDEIAAVVSRIVAAEAPSKDTRQREAELIRIARDYSGLINRICYMYAGSRENFEELRQDVLVNIWRGLHTCRESGALTAWLYRVTINTCVSGMRRMAKNNMVVSLNTVGDSAEYTAEDERISELYALISRLGVMDKAVIMMWLDSRSYDEIGGVLGLTRSGVAARLHKIREKLKQYHKEL